MCSSDLPLMSPTSMYMSPEQWVQQRSREQQMRLGQQTTQSYINAAPNPMLAPIGGFASLLGGQVASNALWNWMNPKQTQEAQPKPVNYANVPFQSWRNPIGDWNVNPIVPNTV